MQFGVKAPEETEIVYNNDRYIKYFDKDGAFTLRFLEEWDEWTSYFEHFSMKYRCSYPCTGNEPGGDPECPGCQLADSQDDADQREGRIARRYLVNAIRTDNEKSDQYVDLWKIPASLKEDILYNSNKDGSLFKREYTIIRREVNGKTNYSLDKEDPMPIDVSVYKDRLRDHNAALTEAWENRWDEAKRAAEQKRRSENKSNGKAPKVHAEGSTEEPPFEQKGFKKGGLSIVPEPEPEPEENINLTVSSIRQMSAPQLRKLYAQGGFEVPDTEDQAVLAEKLIAALS